MRIPSAFVGENDAGDPGGGVAPTVLPKKDDRVDALTSEMKQLACLPVACRDACSASKEPRGQTSHRHGLARVLKGDASGEVIRNLPENMQLLIHG